MGNSLVRAVATGGMLAGVAVVIMCMGSLIPVATYVCPMLCTLIAFVVCSLHGKRIGWAWFGVVAFLSVLLGPDKEAAAVFCCLGYYPMLKPMLDKCWASLLWKLLLFNGAVFVLYGVLLKLFGLDVITEVIPQLGIAGLVILLLLGNVTFFLLDRLLGKLSIKFRKC